MATASKPRTPLKPATGWVRWMGWTIAPEDGGNRLLEICAVNEKGEEGEPKTYEVEPIDDGAGGWNLYTEGKEPFSVICYHVSHVTGQPGVQTCDCPDAMNRPERKFTCKHVRGLRAGLKRLAQTEPF